MINRCYFEQKFLDNQDCFGRYRFVNGKKDELFDASFEHFKLITA